ncbi:MAG: DUF2493 domain-containing protein [Chitinispirillaceae bacterium]|nr:DUF2493 domain-containing protein [Chitinispirillaceae bacterium]
MKIAIVGSRSFPQLKLIEWFVNDLPLGVVIVSGGAMGVDKAAEEFAKNRGLEFVEFLPDLTGCSARHEFTEKYYERNQKIVDHSDLIVAFTEKEHGGTWDTIKRARKANKPVKIIRPSLLFPGDTKEEPVDETIQEEQETDTESREHNKKGRGPFQIKRVSLGSYALRRKLYITTEEWADIVVMKDNSPDELSEKMFPAFVNFFKNSKHFGFIHAITVPPRSIRNIDKKHVMDILAQKVANEFGCDFVRMFEPWEKNSRGRFAKHGEIKVLPEVSKYIGKVIWVLDDVTTTKFTLRAAVQSLMSLEIHAHGLAYVLMA